MNHTKRGNEIKKIISQNFSNYNLLYAGNCICPNCSGCIKESKLRRNNWIITEEGFELHKYSTFYNALIKAYDKGIMFSAFVTTSFKKHGWMNFLFAINTPKTKKISIIFEENLVNISKEQLELNKFLIEKLITVINKKNLLTWNISIKQYENIIKNNLRKCYKQYMKLKRNLCLEMLIYLTESPKRN